MVATTTPPADDVIEVEIDGPRNQACVFRPLQRRIRGRFDLRRVAETAAMQQIVKHPEPIPGQRLRLNTATGKAELIEPLQLPEFAAVRQRYEFNDKGEKLARFPEHENFEKVDVATWLYWLAVEVKAGMARLLRGSLPDPEELEAKAKRNFYTAPKNPREDAMATAMNKMADAMTANTAVMQELLKRMTVGKP
jgi:hypothetical protein